MRTWLLEKNIVLTIRTLSAKWCFCFLIHCLGFLLLFFQGASVLILWLQSPSAVILEPKEIKSVTVSIFPPSICHEVMGLDAMIFKPAFSLSSFNLIKSLFSSSSLSAIRVISSIYLGLMAFLLEAFIPACDSSSLAFCMMYSPYKLNNQGDAIELWCTPFPIWKQPIVPCLVLTVAFDPNTSFSGDR